MKKFLTVFLFFVSTTAFSATYTYYEEVPVVRYEAVFKDITVQVPHKECWEEEEELEDDKKVAGALGGAVVGGVIGNQIGNGPAPLVGAVVGSIVGSNIVDDRPKYKMVTKCKTVYESYIETKKFGYNNYFEYNGKTFVKKSSRRLSKVRLKITISY